MTATPGRELLTVTQYAERAGLNKSTVSRLVKSGVIPNHAPAGAPPRIDPVEADEARRRNVDQSKVRGLLQGDGELKLSGAEAPGLAGGPAGEGGDAPSVGAGAGGTANKSDWMRARTAREAVNAQRARVEYEERIGKLLDRDEVADAVRDVGQIIQRALDQRVHELADRLMGVESASRMAAVIREADRQVLEAMAEGFAKIAADAAPGEVPNAA